MDLPQPWQDVRPLCQIERGDNPIALQPLIDAKLVPDVVPFHHEMIAGAGLGSVWLVLACGLGFELLVIVCCLLRIRRGQQFSM
jgi:hypothetical protein